jgi:ABC-type uncharacterized transport system auxiliary subunit
VKTVVLAALVTAACGGSVPATRYYHLATPAPGKASGDVVLVLDDLATDAGYDDERMVYRVNPYRFDYYDYHRWSALPGILVGNYLERALERTGRFRAVVRERTPEAAVVLTGRIAAIEEVDRSRAAWVGHLVVELRLADAATGEIVWTAQFDETEPMPVQSPEGLARAVSAALARVVARAAPEIAALAEQRRVARRP